MAGIGDGGNQYTVWVIWQDLMRGEPVGHNKTGLFFVYPGVVCRFSVISHTP